MIYEWIWLIIQSLGNHELDLGVKGLVPFLNAVDFPVLVSNINNTADHPLWKTHALKKSAVFDIKGFKVGVIGYLTPETKLVAIPNDLEFISEVLGIKWVEALFLIRKIPNSSCSSSCSSPFDFSHEAETLKNKGVNIIIALGHSGYEVDMDIAKNCPHVDVVIGGHSNTFLYSGTAPDIEKPDGPYPTIIKQGNGKEVPVVQAYAFTKYLGELELSVSFPPVFNQPFIKFVSSIDSNNTVFLPFSLMTMEISFIGVVNRFYSMAPLHVIWKY